MLPKLGELVQREQRWGWRLRVRLQRWQTACRTLKAVGGSQIGDLQEVESRWLGISM